MVLRVVVLVLPSSGVLHSTLPTLATTITLRGLWSMRLRMSTSGRIRRTSLRVPTTCSFIAAVLIRRIAAVVVTVAPYVAPRSGVDSRLSL